MEDKLSDYTASQIIVAIEILDTLSREPKDEYTEKELYAANTCILALLRQYKKLTKNK